MTQAFLLKAWGGDIGKLLPQHPPDALDDNHTAHYWFDSAAQRDAFKRRAHATGRIATAEYDDGPDDRDGELIDTHKQTRALVTLRLPDGREGTFTMSFGYGYPASGVEFMFHDGNYACDCNRALFLARECGIGSEEDAIACGDTIELVKLEITKA